jgi:hypothetical protein
MKPTIIDWQPIETAPKDGTAVLVWPPTWIGCISCAKWSEDQHANRPRPFWSRFDSHSDSDSRSQPPTHWAPLPAGPA